MSKGLLPIAAIRVMGAIVTRRDQWTSIPLLSETRDALRDYLRHQQAKLNLDLSYDEVVWDFLLKAGWVKPRK